jgi:hypothetical protein
MPDLMRNRAPILLLAVAVAASAALLLSLDSHLTFIGDGWALLVKRRGWSAEALLDPFNEHLVLAPALIYKLLVAVFGIGSALPFYAVSVSLFLLCAALLFAYLRPRVGAWPALIAAILVLFLGVASEDLLWEFQMAFFGSIAAGLGMLIALDRQNRRGDQVACGLLAVSLAFSGVGIAFVAAALADLALGRRPRGRRAYVALLPLALYALWWLGWGHTAGSNVSLENLEQLPRYVFDAAAAGIASLLGREPLDPSGHPPLACQLLLVAVLLLAALRIAREREVSRGLAIALTLALAFWMLSGLDRAPDRYATSSRYQYPSAIFLLLIAAELLRGVRIPRLAIAATAVVAAGAVFGGISLLQRDYTNTWKPMADDVRSMLAAVDIAGDGARRDFPLRFPPSVVVPTGAYLAASRSHGSPAFSEAELLARPGPERQNADATLAGALGIAIAPVGDAMRAPGCRAAQRTVEASTPTKLQPGTFTVTNTGQAGAALRLGRFAHGFPVPLGQLRPGQTQALPIPVDNSSRPWKLLATGASLRLCRWTQP